MKQLQKYIFNSIIIVVLLCICLSGLTQLVERKDSKIKFHDFFEEPEIYDVLFFGNSHTIDSIYPMELWHDYGIVSYNMAGHGNRMPTNNVLLKEALTYSKPKLVVIDCNHIKSDRMYSDSIEQVHLSLDAFPLTIQKAKGIHELFHDSQLEKEFLWDFLTYHNRWDSLTKNDFLPGYNTEKGAEMYAGVAVPIEITPFSPDNKLEEATNGTKYLEKIIELCQENDIQILLTYLPFPSTSTDHAESNQVAEIAQKYNVQYVNFLAIEDVVDFDTDCLDEASHLNPSGGRKVTDYLGSYITKHYEIEYHTIDWYSNYEEHTEYKLSLLRSNKNL